MKNILLLVIGIICCSPSYTNGQCPGGQVEVTIEVDVDQYGNEVYWELLPTGNNCGIGTIFSGGNTSVGCNGGGLRNDPPGGYSNNSSNTEGPWCLIDGNDYDIFFVDDYDDGGAIFTVNIEGFPIYAFTGTGTDETFTFTASGPPAIDASITGIEVSDFVVADNISITGDIKNLGTTTITSFDLNYSIDNGAAVTENISALSLAPFTTYEFDHSTKWAVNTTATYSLKVWVDNVNGVGADDDTSNDDMTKSVTVIAATPNIISSYTSTTITVTHEVVGTSSDQVNKPQDLDFHPNGELWVVNRGIGGDVSGGGGTTVTYTDPGGTGQTSLYRKDQNSKHFMNEPTGIAFSLNSNFSTSPGMYDANFDGGSAFTGPALWSSDPLIYAQPSGGNGSHLDMLHASSYAMGIAHETGNVFWIFDGLNNDIVRYDFASDHGPGNTDHDDGKIRRFTGITVDRVNDVIGSHMELDKETGWLYIVDNGNQRVLRLDINSGTVGGTPSYGPFETLAEYKNVDGATWEIVVSSGLVEPSGIDVIDDRMIVTDHSTGEIIIYDITTIPAVEMKRIATGNAGVMGTVIGPEGRIWYVNYLTNEVIKIEPSSIANNAPQANDDMVSVSVGQTIVVDVQMNDFDADPLTTTIFSGPNNGTATVMNGDSISYTANAGFEGSDTLTYTVCDNGSPVLCDNAMVILTVTPTGIEDTRALSKFRIYPNPSSGILNIEIYEQVQGEVTITVTDLLGRIVMMDNAKNSNFSMELNDMESGVYVIKIENGEQVYLKRFVSSK